MTAFEINILAVSKTISAKTTWKDGRCCWTEQRAERTHSRLRQARREAARTGHEPDRRDACVGLAERSERSKPHARASAVLMRRLIRQSSDVLSASKSASQRVMNE
jgi:hypothetical protein